MDTLEQKLAAIDAAHTAAIAALDMSTVDGREQFNRLASQREHDMAEARITSTAP